MSNVRERGPSAPSKIINSSINDLISKVEGLIDDSKNEVNSSKNLKSEIKDNLLSNLQNILDQIGVYAKIINKEVKKLENEILISASSSSVAAAAKQVTDTLINELNKGSTPAKKNKNLLPGYSSTKNSLSGDIHSQDKIKVKINSNLNSPKITKSSYAEIIAAPVKKYVYDSFNEVNKRTANIYDNGEFPVLPPVNEWQTAGRRKRRPSAISANSNARETCTLILKNNKTNEDAYTILKQKVNPTQDGVGVCFAKKLPGGKTLVSCLNQEHVKKLKKLTAPFLDPIERSKKYPQLIIHNLNEDTVENDIKMAVQALTEDPPIYIRIRSYKNKPNEKFAIVSVNSNAWKSLIAQKRIFINWKICPIKNNVSIIRCGTCFMYGHTTKYCKCESPPSLKDDECINCARFNHGRSDVKGFRPVDIAHSTFSRECPSLLRHLRNNVNYTTYSQESGLRDGSDE